MGRLREMLPIINLFDWADGEKYIVEDDSDVVLPPELAESDRKTDEKEEKYFGRNKVADKTAKKSKFKVEKQELDVGKQKQQNEVLAKDKEETEIEI